MPLKTGYVASMEAAFINTHTDPYTRGVYAFGNVRDVRICYDDLETERFVFPLIPSGGRIDLPNVNPRSQIKLTATSASGRSLEYLTNPLGYYTHAYCCITGVSIADPQKPVFTLPLHFSPDHSSPGNTRHYTIDVFSEDNKLVRTREVDDTILDFAVPGAGTYRVEVQRPFSDGRERHFFQVVYITLTLSEIIQEQAEERETEANRQFPAAEEQPVIAEPALPILEQHLSAAEEAPSESGVEE